jgi:hypothetical protein
VEGLLGYRNAVTQERDPITVADRYDLLKMSKLQGQIDAFSKLV